MILALYKDFSSRNKEVPDPQDYPTGNEIKSHIYTQSIACSFIEDESI